MTTRRRATARAGANIALVKYWGKRNERLRLPWNGSISLTLDGLETVTSVELDRSLERDRLFIDGTEREGRDVERVGHFLDLVRGAGATAPKAIVDSRSNVPLGAGLASSAAAFAALALAAAAAYGRDLTRRELSILARRGSGSACRSIFGGFVEWRRGERADGEDSYAEPLLAPEDWAVAMAIAVVHKGAKAVGSTEGMKRSTEAAGYPHWLATVEADLAACRRGVLAKSLALVGLVAESNATKMHLAAASAHPPVLYWTDATARIVTAVGRLRERHGVEAYFTVDAGPNVAVLCNAGDLERVAAFLEGIEGVERVLRCPAGRDAEIVCQP